MTQQNILTGLIIAIAALIVVAVGIMVVLAPAETGPALSVPKAPTPDEMKALAAEIAGQIDGDALAALKPGDENTSKTAPDARAISPMRPNPYEPRPGAAGSYSNPFPSSHTDSVSRPPRCTSTASTARAGVLQHVVKKLVVDGHHAIDAVRIQLPVR